MNPETTLQLIQILEKTVSHDKNELEAAKNFLEQAAQNNLPEYVKTLSDILHHGGNSPVARMAAALQLKNTLVSKDATIKAQYQQRWLAFPEDIRAYIKKNILSSLGTENNRPSSAAQCVAYVAVAELPVAQWPELISVLVNNVVGASSTEMMKEATLEAIGYICQEIEHEVLVGQSNQILTAIIHGMRQTEPSNHVRLAATNALLNSLEFTRANFDKESERNFIMEVVCEATQSPDTMVRVAALQCLVKIMSLYYQYMETYMAQALFPITLEAMKSDIDEVALQGIEFWSNVSDEEVDLSIEESEATEAGRPPQRTSRFYAKGALQYLVPVLMQKLTKQEEFDDEDDWNPSKAAGVCLMLLATCCEDAIVPYVLPFVKGNIKSPDWRYRDAALMAFGSILGGLDPSTLKPLVEQAMPTLIDMMYDVSVAVRDTAAWNFGRVCEIIPEAAINENYLKPLLEALMTGLKSEPRVAANVCWAFSGLAEAAYEAAEDEAAGGGSGEEGGGGGDDSQSTPATYCLSQYFEYIVQRLLETTDRADAPQANLRSAAYEALMEMVKNSPRDCYPTVQKTTLVILERLQQVLQMESHIQNHNDRAQYNDLQSLLCGTLQSVLRKVTPEDAPQISDAIMSALLQMFNSNSGKAGGVQEDALMAVSTLAEVLGEGFTKYMDAFKPFLCLGLKNHAEYQVCSAAVGLTGDICRALKTKVIPYCDEIMMLLLENLSDSSVHRSVKPHILSAFGDVVISIGPEFKKYLDVVMQTLAQASQAQVDRSYYDMIDYLNDLREGVGEACTGIVQGFKGIGPEPCPELALLEPHVPFMVEFIIMIARDPERSEGNVGCCAGLIGDLLSAFGAKMLQLLDVEPINELLELGRKSRAQKTKTLAIWASRELRRLKNANAAAAASAAATTTSCDEGRSRRSRREAFQHLGHRRSTDRLYAFLLLWAVVICGGQHFKLTELLRSWRIPKRIVIALPLEGQTPSVFQRRSIITAMEKDGSGKAQADEGHSGQKVKKDDTDDAPMDLDEVLPTVGEFGRYQKLLLWLVCLPACVPCGFCAFNQLFMADVPEQIWCKVPELTSAQPPLPPDVRRLLTAPPENRVAFSTNQPLQTSESKKLVDFSETSMSAQSAINSNLAISSSPYPSLSTTSTSSIAPPSETMDLSSCWRYNVNFTHEAEVAGVPLLMLRPSNKWPKAPCRPDWGWEYFSESIFSSIVIDFDLVCDHAIYPTIGLAALNTGGPIGVYLFGLLNDRVGRRISFFSCLATLLLGGILTAAAPNFWSWAACRFIVGLTIPAIYQIPFIISLELVGPNYRSFVTVMTCLFYTLGMIILAGVTYLVRDWVQLALVTSAPFLLYFGYWWFLPESPRWLLAKGRLEEASAILEKLANVNGTQLPPGFMQRLKQRMTMHRSQSEESRLKKGPGVMALCRTPNMRLKTALITLNWFANEMVYVGLSYYGPSLGSDQYVSFLLSSLVEVPSYLACWIVMDRWGRRWPLCVCMVLSGISSIVTVLLPEDAVTATLLLFLLAKSSISASFLIIYPFAGELYPTQLRGIGIGASAYIAGLGLIIIPFIVYLGSEMLVLPLVILGVVSVVGGLSGLRLPETLHHRLPQTVEEGEEFGKDWDLKECIRCIPARPASPASSYEDLNANEGTEFEDFSAAGAATSKPGYIPRQKSQGQQESDFSNSSAISTSSMTATPSERTPLGSLPPARRRSLGGRLVRQSSIMETPMDSSGVMTITYWY